MMVDDDASFLRLYRKYCAKEDDLELRTFDDPMDAQMYLEQAPEQFDLVVTDFTMPQMNGNQFAEKIRLIRGDIPILGLSSDPGQFNPRHFGLVGLKPGTKSEFMSLLRIILPA